MPNNKKNTMKRLTMTKTEFYKKYEDNWTKEDLEKEFPPEETFNGFCFKLEIDDLKDVDPDTIVYIGEYAYSANCNRIYTASDFFNIANEFLPQNATPQEIDERANELFEAVDWQSVEALADEYAEDDEEIANER